MAAKTESQPDPEEDRSADESLEALCKLAQKDKLPAETPVIIESILERVGPLPIETALKTLDAESAGRFIPVLEEIAGGRTVRIQDSAVKLSLFLLPAVMFTGESTLSKPFVFTRHGMERLRHAMTQAGLLAGDSLLWTYLRPICPEELARMSLPRRAFLTGNIINERLDPALYAFNPPLPDYICVPFFLAGMANTTELNMQAPPEKQESLLREMVSALSESMEPAPGRFITTGMPMSFAEAMQQATAEFVALAVHGGLRMGASKLNLHLHDIHALPGQHAGLRVGFENHPMEIEPMDFYLGAQEHKEVLSRVQSSIQTRRARVVDQMFAPIATDV